MECGILVLQAGINFCPMKWQHSVLINGLPGKFLDGFLELTVSLGPPLDRDIGVPGKVTSFESMVENRKDQSERDPLTWSDLKFQIAICPAPISHVCSR